ncbi:MAG: RsmE family RNA methyltransferase [Fimbriimonas sp.]|nr:RsmE family RNA methyltransferase [Fimbriimonas sp.]
MLILRSLPRVFIEGATPDEPIEIPSEELNKLRKVLRLSPGAEIAVLPDDGTLIHCRLQTRHAEPIEVFAPETEPVLHLTLAQALPKGDKLDEIVRACTEIGVSHFVLFPSDRTVVKWDDKKTSDRVNRLRTIAREAAEVSFRTRIPTFEVLGGLKQLLDGRPDSVVLSEVEGTMPTLTRLGSKMTIVVGPEGGWSKPELAWIGKRGVTLGPRVLRVDHAGPAASSILLLSGTMYETEP